MINQRGVTLVFTAIKIMFTFASPFHKAFESRNAVNMR